ncbi:hypothetical protein GH714_038931 [Hevea brasiliensis]|uniref:Subtilisin-like protease SBT1.1 n=1 Tax=Hevea brasiliensis TaxID=3981 RepID=A0A6A6MNL9_HEVBR|nr:hypothetical protein GH714_038931 [Hevea brasiliensis]
MILRMCLLLLALTATLSTALIDKHTYVIHMDKTKIPALYHSPGSSKQWYEAIINSVTEFSSQEEEEETASPQLLYVYETAISGFAAKLSKEQVEALSKINGFLAAIPDEMLTLHTTHTPQFLGLQSGKGLWNAQNLASDVIVGILDTGIWPEHVSFKDTGLSAVPSRWKGACESGTKFSPSNCNKKIIGARAFFKDQANFFGLANGAAAGMKYTARIAVYKVCWSLGCANTDLLAAMDQAVADGVDVLSLSLGGREKPFYSDDLATASFGATQNGVFVSCSAGNSGPSSSTVANTAPWIMTVAASYTDRSFSTTVKLGNGQTFSGSSLYSGKATKKLPIAYGRTAGGQSARYCISGSLNKKLVRGKLVVCERGMNGRTAKGEQVKLAGGAGMLLINTQGEEHFADPHVLPATSLGASAGIAIKEYVNSTKRPTASITFKGTTYGNRAPAMAAFSSRGPSSVAPEVIKPDVTAPGLNILAAWPPLSSPSLLKSDNRSVLFNIISGTSMSCPHVSGLAALLKSIHKDWSPAAIKSALMTSAYVLDNSNAPIADFGAKNSVSATPFAFGSGHVNPESASDPGLIYNITTEDYLNYLCSLNYTSSQLVLVSRRSFRCPNNTILQPGDLNYPSFAVNFEGNAKNITKTYNRRVTNVGTSQSTYAVQVQEPNGVSIIIQPKILSFQKLGEELITM